MEEYKNSWYVEMVGEYVHSKRDRELLLRRHVDGITIEGLAEEYKLSATGVKNILRKHRWILTKT